MEEEKHETPPSTAPAEEPISTVEKGLIQAQAVEAARMCYDPEIPVNIYEMGLIYDILVDDFGKILVRMTLTSPHCPAAQSLPHDVETRMKAIPGVRDVRVEVVWTPPWNPTMMSEAARLELGFM
jgi:FeS assembly SUF system protein